MRDTLFHSLSVHRMSRVYLCSRAKTTRRSAAHSSNALLSVVAVFDDGTTLAQGVARATEFATVAYEVDVERVEFSGGHNAVHHSVRELVGAFRGDESDAAEYAKYVRVER